VSWRGRFPNAVAWVLRCAEVTPYDVWTEVSSEAAPHILVVEDDPALSEVLCDELEARGHLATAARTVAQGRERLDGAEFDVALLDLNLPDGSGIEVLRKIADESLPTECLVLTGFAEVATAVEAMRLGAYDYLSKPVAMEELDLLVLKAVDKARLRRENAALRVRLQGHDQGHGLITEDPVMRRLLTTLARAAPSDLPVLILGETGTGKELIARALHRQSPRAGQPFVAINCAAMPETIVESELFGHERGAFTGAVDRKVGLFEAAGRGVLLLDEVGELPATLQAKLLRALETREYFRVGGTRLVRLEARVVSATNRDLLEDIAAGRFREDLYQRLNGVTLSVPPLRERKDDITLLARHFLDLAGGGRNFSRKAFDAMTAYSWPGNVRELEMVVRRTALLSSRALIEPEDLVLEARRPASSKGLRTDLTLAQMELEYIKTVLAKHRGNRGRAAKSLGIDPKTLYNRLKGFEQD
jgi:DNA-binding NtrC family response regulator